MLWPYEYIEIRVDYMYSYFHNQILTRTIFDNFSYLKYTEDNCGGHNVQNGRFEKRKTFITNLPIELANTYARMLN